MKKIALAALLLISAPAWATTVTLDFDPGSYTVVTDSPGNTRIESEGFDIQAFTTFGNPADSGVSASGIFAYGENNFGYCETCSATIIIERLDGQGFGILDFASFATTALFSGTLVGGGSANLGVPVGTGDWLTLETLVYRDENLFDDNYVHLDDIVVTSAVPIPGAVWLFGTALAGLGWRRRRA